MFKLVELKNFRGFDDARLTELGAFNVLTGLNGSGKTSLLEAIFLAAGGANATLSASLFGFRGERGFATGSEKVFKWIFKNLDPTITPRIVASTSVLMKLRPRYRRELSIKPIYQVAPTKTTTEQETVLRGVTFEFQGPSGRQSHPFAWSPDWEKLVTGREKIPPSEILLAAPPTSNPDLIVAHFVSPYVRDLVQSDHENLTKLTTERRMQEVVDALKLIAPNLKALLPLTENKEPIIYADMGGKAYLPLSLVGAGMVNCLHIVLPSLQQSDGILLFDEIEDGIHHTLYEPMLKIVMDQAKKRKNQVFLSTHSNELLRSLIDLAKKENEKEISFYRLGKLGLNGLIPRYTLDEAEQLLDQNMDVR